MKILTMIGFLCASLLLSACGSDSQPQADEIVWSSEGEPEVIVHKGPAPRKLIVEDFREGTGAELKKGSSGTFRYKEFDYRTGKESEDWWHEPFHTSFGEGESLGAWETGLKGLKVGGRRALIVPAAEAYNHVPVIYVVELAAVR